jgi:hypothetical protein
MPIEDQVKILESEFKLIKSELRQTLVSVRDFLLDLKVPPMQEDSLNGNQSQPGPSPNTSAKPDEAANSRPDNGSDAGLTETFPAEPEPASEYDALDNGDALPPASPEPVGTFELPTETNEPFDFNDENTGVTAGEIPNINEDNSPSPCFEGKKDMNTEENCSSVSQVNLLANLIRWAAVARQEIGMEQLPVFLDLYAVSGNLSAETRDLILHLAEVAADPGLENKALDRNRLLNEQIGIFMEINGLSGPVPAELKENLRRLTELLIQQSFSTNKSNIWSQLILELHGILVGQGAGLRPFAASDVKAEKELESDIPDEVPPPEPVNTTPDAIPPKKKTVKPAKLRLVFPVNDGSEQELDLGNLFISSEASEDDENGHQEGNGHNQFSIV